MNALFGSEFPLCVYTEDLFSLCLSLYCVPRSQWRKLFALKNKTLQPHHSGGSPAKTHSEGARSLGVEEAGTGLCPSQLH